MKCDEAKRIDLVDYLSSLGYQPQQVRNQDYWYLSPLREEKTASFKVNRALNLFYDFGTGQGGSIIDFGMLYYRCPLPEVLDKLERFLSFHRPVIATQSGTTLADSAQRSAEAALSALSNEEKKIRVTGEGSVASPALVRYLQERGISLEVARQFCQEVTYTIGDRSYYAIGFKNDAGGYELRNVGFKGSSSPKNITFIDNGKVEVMVMEGFFNFLSFREINRDMQTPACNFLILNSLSLFEKSRPLMERHGKIHLLLDNDASGKKWTTQALTWSNQYQDGSDLYHPCKDLNAWLVQNTPRHSLRNPGGNQAYTSRTQEPDEPPDKPENHIRRGPRPR